MRYMLSFQCETQEEAQAVLSAVAAIGKEPHACSKSYVDPNKFFKHEESTGDTELLHYRGSDEAPRPNIDPGEPSIGKIGTNTKEQLLGMLSDGHQPPERWCEHMKLLWSRGVVGFDGEEYYTL